MTTDTEAAPAGNAHPLLADFLGHLRHERRLSANTALNYERDVRELLRLAGRVSLADLRASHVRRHIAQLHARGLSGVTLARMLSAWRGFFRFLARDHGYALNPCDGVRAPK